LQVVDAVEAGGRKLKIGSWIGFQILPQSKNLNLILNLSPKVSVMSQFIPQKKCLKYLEFGVPRVFVGCMFK
jgi:hypothetical protein